MKTKQNIAKAINKAARPLMLANNLQTRIIRSKKNNPHLSRRAWKQNKE